MKRFFHIGFCLLILSSCSSQLPSSFYKKELSEKNYVENKKDNYSIHIDPENKLLKEGISENISQLNDSVFILKNQKRRPTLKIISKNDTTQITNRNIYFKNVVNFRDIGGLKTLDGKQIKWGKLNRSDNLSKLKSSEFKKLNSLGIKTIFDLRTANEIKGKEDSLPENITYIHFPTVEDNEDLLNKMKSKVINGEITEEMASNLMLQLYEGNISDNISTLSKLIHQIINSDAPVLYHYSAGKDRTGIVSALVLSILNVDRELIIDEYLLSNYYRRNKIESLIFKAKIAKIVKPKLQLKAIQNFMRVDEKYINIAFQTIDSKYGGMENFIKNELKISTEQRNAFIKKLTY